MRRLRISMFLMATLVTGPAAQPMPEVPAEYQDLYLELFTAISEFRETIDQSWDGTPGPAAFSANLLTANSSQGDALLTPDRRDAVGYELDGLQALGVTAVSLDVSFPVLHPPFHQSPEEYQQYLDFYTEIADDIRGRGLTLIVETQVLFTEGGFTAWDPAPYYASLTTEEYRQGRMEVARTIALALDPDYLSVIQEPDTEADQTGKAEVGTLAGATTLLETILTGLQAAGVQGVAVGAGFGTWQTDYLSFANDFAQTGIDFLDIHVYPVNRDFLDRAVEIADVASSYGKPAAMTETWLYKVRESELDTLSFSTIFSRDVFSFWTPLDSLHLQAMVELAHFKSFAFMSPFWSGYFRGYLDYDDTTKDLTPEELLTLKEEEQLDNILAGVYTGTGLWYLNAIIDAPDISAPIAPPDLVAQLTSPTSAALTWSQSPDDTGTAFYRVFRDQELITTTGVRSFMDADLADAQRFVYSVVAVDASGNASAPASAVVTTPDTTPPTIPGDVAAIAILQGAQIDITVTWSPSTDDVGVARYRVYRGTTPADLTLLTPTTTTELTIPSAPPETTFFLAVSAVDAAWNDSGQSLPVGVTTPPIPDTTPPVVSVPFPTDGATVTRTTFFFAVVYDLRGGLWDVPSGPAGVQFTVDSADVGPDQTVPFFENGQFAVYRLQVDTRSLPNGEAVIQAVARDAAGNVAVSDGVTVTVSNP